MRLGFRTVLPILGAYLIVGCGGSRGNGKNSEGAAADGTAASDGFDPNANDGTAEGADGTPGQDAGADGVDTAGADSGAADANDGTDSTGEDGSEPVITGIQGFTSPELFIQIVGPGDRSHVGSTASVVAINGVLFGHAAEIVWQAANGETGQATGNEFWGTGPITLIPGDNQIVVTATDGAGKASVDTIVVTYSPGVAFDAPAIARPDAIYTGVAQRVAVSMRTPSAAVLADSFVLFETDAGGNTMGQVGPMVDTGDLTSDCDEIAGDGVYSICIEVQSPDPTTRYLRVNAKVQAGPNLTTLASPLTSIDIVEPLQTAECNVMQTAAKDAHSAYNAALGAGAMAAADAALASLKANPQVAEAGMNDVGYGIWMIYKNGIVGALNVGRSDTRGGQGSGQFGQVQAPVGTRLPLESRNVLALAPANAQFGPFDETPQIAAQLEQLACPDFSVSGPHLNGGASLARFREAANAGILLFSGHSDGYFLGLGPEVKDAFGWEHSGTQEVLWSGEAVDCSALTTSMDPCSSDIDCSGTAVCVFNDAGPSGVCVDRTVTDLRRGRVVFGADAYGVHPELFRKYAQRGWPDSLAYLGGCRTMYSGTLAAAMFGLGAKAIAGFTDYVGSAFAADQAKNWFTRMMAEGVTTGLAANFPTPEPERPKSQFVLFGGTNVSIAESEILNPGWESGDTTGWTVAGDGRVIGRLGEVLAPSGKFMGIVSTGLGYTQTTGEMAQSFCIPAGREKLTVYWRFYSEEFKEFCGSTYQDAFEASLESAGGSVELVNVQVDDLCGPNDNDCYSCGAKHVGLEVSDVGFDQGDVWRTPLQTATIDITAFAGQGPVTLRLFATDVGDSVYDSAILVDGVLLE